MASLDAAALWVLAAGLAVALLNWIAVWRRMKRLEYVSKPATLVAFIVAAWLLARHTGWCWVAIWFLPALVLSLVGDVLLMLPSERWFLPGILAFLLAQIAYIIGLNATLPPPGAFLLLPVLALVDWVVLRRLVGGVNASGVPELRVPVIVYAVVLSLTLFSGLATWFRITWGWQTQVAAGVGGALFFTSDLMLAWNRFVRQSRILHAAVMVTYHLAQLALVMVIGLAR
jgi:uncharacterized membrane protein YhhN